MHPFFRVAYTFILAALLGGCASVSVYEGPNAGFAVTSIAVRSSAAFDTVGLHFRRRGSGADRGRLWFSKDFLTVGPKADFDTAQSKGFFGSLRLAPGEYEIYNVEARYGNNWFSIKQDFSIPFTVGPGAITYVGAYTFDAVLGKNIFGSTIPAGPVIFIGDQQARDVAVINARLPETAGMSVQRAIPDPKALRLPYFPAAPAP
jgi:hypothetical protein